MLERVAGLVPPAWMAEKREVFGDRWGRAKEGNV